MCFADISIGDLVMHGEAVVWMEIPIGNALERLLRFHRGDPDIFLMKLDGQPIIATTAELQEKLGIDRWTQAQSQRVAVALEEWVAEGREGIQNVDELLQ